MRWTSEERYRKKSLSAYIRAYVYRTYNSCFAFVCIIRAYIYGTVYIHDTEKKRPKPSGWSRKWYEIKQKFGSKINPKHVIQEIEMEAQTYLLFSNKIAVNRGSVPDISNISVDLPETVGQWNHDSKWRVLTVVSWVSTYATFQEWNMVGRASRCSLTSTWETYFALWTAFMMDI